MLNSNPNWACYPSLKFEKVGESWERLRKFKKVKKVCASSKSGKKLDLFVHKEKISIYKMHLLEKNLKFFD